MANVLIEVRAGTDLALGGPQEAVSAISIPGVQIDAEFGAIPMAPAETFGAAMDLASEAAYLVRSEVPDEMVDQIRALSNVLAVWTDTYIEPFPCPVQPCDCDPSTPHGGISEVAAFLGVDAIWSAGYQGDGMAIGIVDGGINAVGRTQQGSETEKVNNVSDGWPSDWGTTAQWSQHGNMTSTDALGMAPNARIYDMRIATSTVSGLISNAIAAYQWAINHYRTDGTPQVLSNSWGIFQLSWDPVYGQDPNHPFTRKVVEALDTGLLVLFAAGNCGEGCPAGRCGTDTGPGRDIWGANGHPKVMTVGAVNTNWEWIGYSSQGPAALDPNKPDFCSVSHFTGFFNSDSGTSAACPIAAGVVALFKQANPSLTEDQAKQVIMTTAADIGQAGWDQHTGAGVLQAKSALDALVGGGGGGQPAAAPPWPGRYLKYPPFMSGEDVQTWQARMQQRGWSIDVDGWYGPGSAETCRQFQEQQGLSADGIVGPDTWDRTWSAP